jgi:hypothetical protein
VKQSTWNIWLPAVAALLGALVGATGATAATYLTLRDSRAAEQRKLQADSYINFLDATNSGNREISEYEKCEGACSPQATKATEIRTTVYLALRRVFIYGSVRTYLKAAKLAHNLFSRDDARRRGSANRQLMGEYDRLEIDYLSSVCNEVNAVRQGC